MGFDHVQWTTFSTMLSGMLEAVKWYTSLMRVDHVQGATFSTMLSGMLEAVKWPPDPWALIAPNQTAGNESMSPRVQAKRAHISTATLCAHPSRPIYISGLLLSFQTREVCFLKCCCMQMHLAFCCG